MPLTATRARKKRISFSNAAMILVGTSMVAQLLGFLRTKLINANFIGAGVPPDQNAGVYFAAFVLPDLFFFTIAAGALGVAFMPYLSDRLQKGDRKGVWELASSLLNYLSLVLFVVGLVVIVETSAADLVQEFFGRRCASPVRAENFVFSFGT